MPLTAFQREILAALAASEGMEALHFGAPGGVIPRVVEEE